MRDTSSLVYPVAAGLIWALSILWNPVPSEGQALFPLQITVDDPAGDNTGPIDVLEMNFLFDDISGAYKITLITSDSAPFLGDFRVNVNIFNFDADSFFADSVNDFSLLTPSTALTLAGISPELTSWRVGDRVYTNSLFGTPNPPGVSFFRTSISSAPHSFLSNEDYVAFENPELPAIVQNASPIDSDGDGVADAIDACPDIFGEPENSGCPTAPNDQDGDGIADDSDACPDIFGLGALQGCPTHYPPRRASADLFIQMASYSAFSEPGAGWNLPPSSWMIFPVALITNTGPDSSRNFSVSFNLGGVRQRVAVAELRAGESLFVSPPRDSAGRGITLRPGSYELKVVIDSSNKVPETNESNNVYIVRVLLESN